MFGHFLNNKTMDDYDENEDYDAPPIQLKGIIPTTTSTKIQTPDKTVIQIGDFVKDQRNIRSVYDYDFNSITKISLLGTAPSVYDAMFRYDHCLRVAERMQFLSNPYTDRIDTRKLNIGGVVHDIYKFSTTHHHGKAVSIWLRSGIFGSYLNDPNTPESEVEDLNKLFEAIRYHSKKNDKYGLCNENDYLKLLLDSDVLDKLTPEWLVGKYLMANKKFTKIQFNALKSKYDKKVSEYVSKTSTGDTLRNSLTQKFIDYTIDEAYVKALELEQEWKEYKERW